nr:hypothetical protein [Tanacetum cinerariifolium]
MFYGCLDYSQWKIIVEDNVQNQVDRDVTDHSEKVDSEEEVIGVCSGSNESNDGICIEKENKVMSDEISSEKSINDFEKKLLEVPTEIDDNGIKVVIFDEMMIEDGSKRWEKTVCAYIVGYGMFVNKLRIGKPIKMDTTTAFMCKMGVGRIGFARVLVEVSAKKELPYEIGVVGNNGRMESTKVVGEEQKNYVKTSIPFGTCECMKNDGVNGIDGNVLNEV